MHLERLSVKARLTLGFGLLALFVLATSVLALVTLSSANERFGHYIAGVNARGNLAASVQAAVLQRAVAARNLVLLSDSAEIEAEQRRVTQTHEVVETRLAELRQQVQSPRVTERARTLVAEIDRVEKAYGPVALAIVKLAAAGQRDEATARMNQECRPLLAQIIKATEEYASFTAESGRVEVIDSQASYAQQRNLLLGLCGAALLLATGAGLLITRSLLQALGAEPAALSVATQRVASGDLSPVANADRAPAGSVLASLGEMQTGLAGIVGGVREAASSIATGSAQIAIGNTDLSQRTEEQASNLQQTAASMEQLSGTVKSNADTAQQASQMAIAAAAAAARGGEVVNEVVATMADISMASQKIADIIGVIDGIAFQTNILALNAAVEAARAGEQGRGFAVVAGEVRNLAQRSATAAREIKGLIGDSADKVANGSHLVSVAGQTMGDIVSQVRRVSDLIGEISSATVEQTAGIDLVGNAVSQLDQMTQQNAALVEESAAAAESLKHQADRLDQTMRRFKLVQRSAAAA